MPRFFRNYGLKFYSYGREDKLIRVIDYPTAEYVTSRGLRYMQYKIFGAALTIDGLIEDYEAEKDPEKKREIWDHIQDKFHFMYDTKAVRYPENGWCDINFEGIQGNFYKGLSESPNRRCRAAMETVDRELAKRGISISKLKEYIEKESARLGQGEEGTSLEPER